MWWPSPTSVLPASPFRLSTCSTACTQSLTALQTSMMYTRYQGRSENGVCKIYRLIISMLIVPKLCLLLIIFFAMNVDGKVKLVRIVAYLLKVLITQCTGPWAIMCGVGVGSVLCPCVRSRQLAMRTWSLAVCRFQRRPMQRGWPTLPWGCGFLPERWPTLSQENPYRYE